MTPSEQSYAEIPLTQGQVAIVNLEDFEWLSQWKWCALWDPTGSKFYASRSHREPGSIKPYPMAMHRLILGLQKGDKRQADHIDGNGLNNRRSNLRICTPQQNTWNRRGKSGTKSGLKGASWYARDKNWRAQIRIGGKYMSLGLYPTAEEAHAAYRAAARDLQGEFARFE